MCNRPPPPPPLPSFLNPKHLDIKCKIPNINKELINKNLCTWASHYPELQEACIRNSICLNNPPYGYQYSYIESLLQEGPTCGLVALSMMLNEEICRYKLLDIAKEAGYSNNGEIFSCKDMLKLTEKALSICSDNNKHASLQRNGLSSDFIVKSLYLEAMLLVPYDADVNHTPCLKQGHKAHWALVCGIITCESPEGGPGDIYVLCKHGKSRYLSVWPLKQLEESNKNLYEFSPKRGEDNLIYILPEGGIGGENGLRSQYILINNQYKIIKT